MNNPTAALALLCALLLGALARDAFTAQPARASSEALTRSDVNAIVRALQDNAKANAEVARAVADVARSCR